MTRNEGVRRRTLGILLLVMVVSGTACGQVSAPQPGQVPQNVILISWDGVDRSVLKELLNDEKLPNLAALIKEGSLQAVTVTGHQTETMPGHAQMLTGLDPATTGVKSNTVYRPIPQGYTIFERVQAFLGGKDNIRTIMVTGKIGNVGGRGPGEVTGMKRTARQPGGPPGTSEPIVEKEGEPFFLTKKNLDVFDAANRNAGKVGELFLKKLEQFKSPRLLAFAHFADPDGAGHAYGSGSKEYRDAMVTCDGWLGKIVEWLKKENLYDKTLIYVTADHGFDPNARTHSNAPNAWLATDDKAVKHGGTQADVPATILARFGVDVSKLEPKLIGKPLTGVPVPAEQVPQPVGATAN